MFGKTHSTKTADVEKQWYLFVDAKGLVVGRLATIVAMRLRGKHEAQLHARMSTTATTSSSSMRRRWCSPAGKRDNKVYHHYTGYIGGIKERSAK